MKIFILPLLILLHSSSLFCQDEINFKDEVLYNLLSKKSDSLYRIEDYQAAANLRTEAFKLDVRQIIKDGSKYLSARTYSMSGDLDIAFEHLYYLAHEKSEFKYLFIFDYHDYLEETGFKPLHKDPRWKEFIATAKTSYQQLQNGLDHDLVNLIDSLRENDQKYRKELQKIQEEFGHQSYEAMEFGDLMVIQDSINLTRLEKVMDKQGWPGIDKIGYETSFGLFLIMQHADLKVQEKYLPLIIESARKGLTISGVIPMIEDRISLRKRGVQIYGTQWCVNKETEEWYLCPIEDPQKLRERQIRIIMQSIDDQLALSGMTWNPDAYEELLPHYKEIYKRDTPIE